MVGVPDIQPGDRVIVIDRLCEFCGMLGTVEGTPYPGKLTGLPTVDVKLLGLEAFPAQPYDVDQIKPVRVRVAA